MDWRDLGTIIAALGGLGGVVAVWDALRRHRRISLDQSQVVTNNAVKLIEQLRGEVDSLREQLKESNGRADTLNSKLRAANTFADTLQKQADDLSIQLADAQTDMRHMRLTIKSLGDELDKYTPGDARRRTEAT